MLVKDGERYLETGIVDILKQGRKTLIGIAILVVVAIGVFILCALQVSFEKKHPIQKYQQEFCKAQKGQAEPVTFRKDVGFQFGMGFGSEETERLVDELVADGLLTENEDGLVYVTDWENQQYHFKG